MRIPPGRTTWCLLLAGLAALIGVGLGPWPGPPDPGTAPELAAPVGGAANPCRCSLRIEPED